MGPIGPIGPQGPPGVPPAQTLQLSAYNAFVANGTVGSAASGCVTFAASLLSPSVTLDVPLPTGALITGVRVRSIDASVGGAAVTMALRQVNGFTEAGNAIDALASAALSSTPPAQGVDPLVLNTGLPRVSDSTFFYLTASAPALSSALSFCGASVDYTLA